MSDKIIALVGESGSGKTTIAELLEKEGYNYIQSYTTRKPRYDGERGHTFITREDIVKKYDLYYNSEFYSLDAVLQDLLYDNSVAYTFYDNEHYYMTEEQYEGKGVSVYIIDPAGVKELKENIEDAKLLTIYLNVDESNRFDRMVQERPLDVVKDRITHDKEAFRVIQCDYTINANRSIEEVLKDVKLIIKNKI